MGAKHFWKTLQRASNRFVASQGGRETPSRPIARRDSRISPYQNPINGVPSYWGTSPGMFPPTAVSSDQIYVETRPREGGLSYEDAVAVYLQVKTAYEDSRKQAKGQTVKVRDANGLDTHVDLVIEGGLLILKSCKLRSSGEYGKPTNIEEILGYQAPLPITTAVMARK